MTVRLPVVRYHLATIESTNAYAAARIATFSTNSLTVVTADEQTAGRGRLGRQWVSGAGLDIMATFAFRLPPSRVSCAYQLSPFLAVVVRRVLAAHGVSADIKWPNDLLLSRCRKFGGILCELESLAQSDYWAALGLGLNVNSIASSLGAGIPRPVWPLTTLLTETGRPWDVPLLTEDLINGVAEVRG